jgi:hypothetical protein
LKIKEIYVYKDLDEDSFFEDITLVCKPNGDYYVSARDEFFARYGNCLGFNSDVADCYPGSLDSLQVQDTEDIKINDIIIGKYFKERNLIVIFFNPFRWNWDDRYLTKSEEKEYLKVHLDVIEAIKKAKIKKIDINKTKERLLVIKFQEQINKEIKEKGNAYNYNIKMIEEMSESIVSKEKENKTYREAIKSMLSFREQLTEELFKRIEEVKKLQFVKDVSINPEGIKVNVGKISMDEVYLGDYMIHILPSKIKIYNKHKPQEVIQHHMHVNSEGNPCWGNARRKVEKLQAEYRFKELIFFAYSFLNSYNSDDPYISFSDWKHARDEENKFDSEGNPIN